jgi:hypothetical protein
MPTFDTIKLQIPCDIIQGPLPPELWLYSHDADGGQYAKFRTNIAKELPGITSATADLTAGHINIEASAKILRDNYLQGICAETAEQFAESVMNSIGIHSTIADFIQYAKVLKVDTFAHIHLPELQQQSRAIVQTLEAARNNANYTTTTYQRKGNMGIVYEGQFTSIKARLIFYNKYLDMLRSKNRAFFQSCTDANKLLQAMKFLLRCEVNTTSFDKIRKRHKTPDNKLTSLLLSTAKPNLDMFNIICGQTPSVPLQLFNQYNPDQYTIDEVFRIEGMKTIFAMVGNNEKAMRSIIHRYTNSKDTAKNIWTGRRGKGATKGVRDYFRQYHQQQLQQNAGAIELIETIKQQLSA